MISFFILSRGAQHAAAPCGVKGWYGQLCSCLYIIARSRAEWYPLSCFSAQRRSRNKKVHNSVLYSVCNILYNKVRFCRIGSIFASRPHRDEAQGKSPARSAPRCPKGFRAALRNIWPSANRDEAQSKSPARSAPRCSKGFRAALRNIWPSANRDEAQGKSPTLSIIMYPFLFLQAAPSALLYF